MAKIKSTVVAGEYKGSEVISTKFLGNYLTIMIKGSFLSSQAMDITRRSVAMYEILDEEMMESNASKILEEEEDLREQISSFVFSAPEKGTYVVAIKFKDERVSILELDEKKLLQFIETFQKPDILNYLDS